MAAKQKQQKKFNHKNQISFYPMYPLWKQWKESYVCMWNGITESYNMQAE